ncbi:nudC domain-containing protein 1 [Orussus abietinus]|uniref:nudC domain-containing protein 1 n=1 Tax=Orussus abietinus TaxID=222816 RepID=UPI0006263A70|nr:nudC domain-containing protein 1 [Orussus abietinus]
MKVIELRPNTALINQNFEKYQFSAEIVPVEIVTSLEKDVFRVEVSSSQESWLEARLFAFHNHLFKNPFDMSCWFVDVDGRVWRLEQDGTLKPVGTITIQSDKYHGSMYNPSIKFGSRNIAVISNGCGNLQIIIENGNEGTKPFTFDIDCGIVMDAQHIKDKKLTIVTLCSVVDIDGKKCSRITLLSYLHEIQEDSVEVVTFKSKQTLRVRGAVECIYMERNGNYIQIVSQEAAAFEHDESSSNEDNASMEKDVEVAKTPRYYWSQDEDTLTVLFKVPNNSEKSKLKINVAPFSISILLDDIILLQGNTRHRLESELTTWEREKDTLKVNLFKFECGLMWNELIEGDIGAEYLPNETLAAEIHLRLAHLCTDMQDNKSTDQAAIGFNAEQMEECDLLGKEHCLQRINFNSYETTHLINFGTYNTILFTCSLKHGQALCLRQDHDGCVWETEEVDSEDWNLEHVHTFPGFGYIEASKTNKKFCISPPDWSYIAIIEHTRHVFIYETPKKDAQVGRQRILDLGCEAAHIMGVCATKKYLILLTKNQLYHVRVNS